MRNLDATSSASPNSAKAASIDPRARAASSKCVNSSRRRSSRSRRVGTRARASTSSTNATTRSCSVMAAEDGLHGDRDRGPLPPLGFGAPPSFWCETVVLARPPGVALAPRRSDQAGPLHLPQRRIERAFLQLKRPRAASLGFLQHLVAIHGPLDQEAQNQDANGAGQELAIVMHGRMRVQQGTSYLAEQGRPSVGSWLWM